MRVLARHFGDVWCVGFRVVNIVSQRRGFYVENHTCYDELGSGHSWSILLAIWPARSAGCRLLELCRVFFVKMLLKVFLLPMAPTTMVHAPSILFLELLIILDNISATMHVSFFCDSLGHSCADKCIPHLVIWALLNPKTILKTFLNIRYTNHIKITNFEHQI